MIKVCLDTNVFISAFLFAGKPAEVFDLALDQKIILIASPAIFTEITQVLRGKFKQDESYIKKQLKVLSAVCRVIEPKINVKILKYNPDNRILECALEGKVDFIISGDKKHLLKLRRFKNIPIITPSQFLSSSTIN